MVKNLCYSCGRVCVYNRKIKVIEDFLLKLLTKVSKGGKMVLMKGTDFIQKTKEAGKHV